MFCYVCMEDMDVVGYECDNPVLRCGHVKESLSPEERAEMAHQIVEILIKDLRSRGYSEEDAIEVIIKSNMEFIQERQDRLDVEFSERQDKVPVEVIRRREVRRKHLSSSFKSDKPEFDTPIPMNTWEDIRKLSERFGRKSKP